MAVRVYRRPLHAAHQARRQNKNNKRECRLRKLVTKWGMCCDGPFETV